MKLEFVFYVVCLIIAVSLLPDAVCQVVSAIFASAPS